MIDQLFYMSIWLMRIFNIALLIVSINFAVQGREPRTLRFFYLYILSEVIGDIVITFAPKTVYWTNAISLMIELFYLTYVLLSFIKRKRIKPIIWIADFLVLFMISYNASRGQLSPATVLAIILRSFIFLILCVVYFRELFAVPKIVNISREPAFWIVVGCVCLCMLEVPTVLVSELFIHQHKWNYYTATFSIFFFLNTSSIILFIKAMTCRKIITF